MHLGMKASVRLFALSIVAVLWGSTTSATPPLTGGLTPGASYTVLLEKMNSNGSLTLWATTSFLADASGEGSFAFPSVPTAPDTFFMVVTIKDYAGTPVRQALIPCPASGSNTLAGMNKLTHTQVKGMLQALQAAGTDSPTYVAYALTAYQAVMSDTDAIHLAFLLKDVILGANGVVDAMKNQGATNEQLLAFNRNLVNNPSGSDLADYSARLKNAVDATSSSTASDALAVAGALLARIFVGAATSAGMDPEIVRTAHMAGGAIVPSSPYLAQIPSSVMMSIGQSMEAAQREMNVFIIKEQYTSALQTLGAGGPMIQQFNTAVDTLTQALEAIHKTYQSEIENMSMDSQESQAMMNAFQTAFTQFESNIRASNGQINDMIAAVQAAVPGFTPPGGFGTYFDQQGNPQNWPITQCLLYTWVANTVSAGGSISFTRLTDAQLPIPAGMTWLPSRTANFGTGSAMMEALMGIQEDEQIAQWTWYAVFDGPPPSPAQGFAAIQAFRNHLALIQGNISGTTDGSTPSTNLLKWAILTLVRHPDVQ